MNNNLKLKCNRDISWFHFTVVFVTKYYSSTDINSSSQFAIYLCIYKVFHSPINVTSGECHGTWQSDEYELTAEVTVHAHLFIKSYIYSLLSVPLALTQAVTHLLFPSPACLFLTLYVIHPLFLPSDTVKEEEYLLTSFTVSSVSSGAKYMSHLFSLLFLFFSPLPLYHCY